MAAALEIARALRDVLLDLHDSVAESEIAFQASRLEFPGDPAAERLRLILRARVQSDVAISMGLAHLADAVVEALERAETNA